MAAAPAIALLLTALSAGAEVPFLCAGSQAPAAAARRAGEDLYAAAAGEPRVLVLFARFQGEYPGQTAPPAWADSLFDRDRPGSIDHFYDEMSRGRLAVHGLVAPRWYEASRPAGAYAGADPAEKGPFGRLALELLQQADADLDLAAFDGDRDGVVDAVLLALLSAPPNFLRGPATGIASLGLANTFLTDDRGADGAPVRVVASRGTVQVARTLPLMAGTMCHEFAHLFGLPDLHHTAFSGGEDPARDSAGIGAWGLMGWGALGWDGLGGPNPLSAWSRVQLGWAEVVDVFADAEQLRLEEVGRTGQVARVRLPSRETFYLEYRGRGSWYDRDLPGEGLLIWHADPRGQVDPGAALTLDLECADGRWLDAGFPVGQRPDAEGGGDNLDYWAHDGAYARAHAGNLGDATDPFDGVRYRRFAADTNPGARDHTGAWSIELDDLRIGDGVARARLRVPPLVRFDRVVVRGADSSRVVAGEEVAVDVVLTAQANAVGPDLYVTFGSDDPDVSTLRSGLRLHPGYADGEAVYRSGGSFGDSFGFRVRPELTGIRRIALRLSVFEGESPDLVLVSAHTFELTAVGARQPVRQVEVVDSLGNGDGRAQPGEVVALRLGFPAAPGDLEILSTLGLALRSLDGRARALGTSRVAWRGQRDADSLAVASSGEWLVDGGVRPGDALAFELELSGRVTTAVNTLQLIAGDGADAFPPRVGAVNSSASREGLRVSLPLSRVDEGSRVRSARVEVRSPDGALRAAADLAPLPHRWEATLPDLPPGAYLVRAVVEDEWGNLGAGPASAVTMAADPPARAPGLAAATALSGPVLAVAWSPVGLIAAADGAGVRLLDDVRLTGVRDLAGHAAPVTDLAFSSDGRWLASAGQDGAVRLWDPASGAGIAVLPVAAPPASARLAFAADGALLAAAVANRVLVWEAALWDRPWRSLPESGVLSVALDSRRVLATGRADGTIQVWDPLAGRVTQRLAAHDSPVSALALAPGGESLASADWAGVVTYRSLEDGPLRRGAVHTDRVVDLAFDPAAFAIASASWDGAVRLERTEGGVRRTALDAAVEGPESVALAPDGLQLAVGTWTGRVEVWRLGSPPGPGGQALPAVDLLPAYPNPSNRGTWIPFRLRRDGPVRAVIYNAAGQPVRRLAVAPRQAGDHFFPGSALHWDGTDDAGRPIGSGVYFVALTAGGATARGRILLLR